MKNEKRIERKLIREVKSIGGITVKLFSPWFTGLPDRLILLPGGKARFVETKSNGDQPSRRQQLVHRLLKRLGFQIDVIDNDEALSDFLNDCRK